MLAMCGDDVPSALGQTQAGAADVRSVLVPNGCVQHRSSVRDQTVCPKQVDARVAPPLFPEPVLHRGDERVRATGPGHAAWRIASKD